MNLSIVCSLYCSESYIEEFYHRVVSQAEMLGVTFEIVFVDDGSPDRSLEIALSLARTDGRIRVVELSKNHGHHRAMYAGLQTARGDRVFLTDVDLEEPPENLVVFWRAMEREQVDVVYGEQQRKHGSGTRLALSKYFYMVFNAFSTVKISDRELVSRLMTRQVVDSLLAYGERELFLPAVWTDVGFRQIPIQSAKSFDGQSSYTLRKKLKMAVDAVTSFSSGPLLLIFYLGVGMSAFSGLAILLLVVRKLAFNSPLLGWTSILASIFLVGGLILFSLGVIGIYLSRIFTEVKQRPYPIIRKISSKENLTP